AAAGHFRRRLLTIPRRSTPFMILRAITNTRRLALLAVAVTSVAAAPAQAQLFGGDAQARQAILNLRQELGDVRSEGQRGRLQLASQVEQLQRQIDQLRGQIETLSKQVADSQQAQRDMYLDMSERQQRPAGSPDAASILGANADEQAAYDSAIDLFRNADYKGAAQALRSFVTQYPNSGFAPTAQFYLGSSHYALKDYKNAID